MQKKNESLSEGFGRGGRHFEHIETRAENSEKKSTNKTSNHDNQKLSNEHDEKLPNPFEGMSYDDLDYLAKILKPNTGLKESFIGKKKPAKKFTRPSSNINNKNDGYPKDEKTKIYRGKTIYADGINDIDEILRLCDKYWNIIERATIGTLLDHLKEYYPNVNIPEKDRNLAGMAKYIVFTGGVYLDKIPVIALAFKMKFDPNADHYIVTSLEIDKHSKILINSGFQQ